MYPRSFLALISVLWSLSGCVTVQIRGAATPASEVASAQSLTWYAIGTQGKDASGNPAPQADLYDENGIHLGEHFAIYSNGSWSGVCWVLGSDTICGSKITKLNEGTAENAPDLYVVVDNPTVPGCTYVLRDRVGGGVITAKNPRPDYRARYRCFSRLPTIEDVDSEPGPVRVPLVD